MYSLLVCLGGGQQLCGVQYVQQKHNQEGKLCILVVVVVLPLNKEYAKGTLYEHIIDTHTHILQILFIPCIPVQT